MRAVTAAEMKIIERNADMSGVSYTQMMENAGFGAYSEIIKRYGGTLHTLEVLYADSISTHRKSDSIVMKAVVFPKDEKGLNMTVSAIRALDGIRDLYID